VSHLLFAVSATICLFGSVVLLLAPASLPLHIPVGSSSAYGYEPFSLAAFYGAVPYTSSWQSWWHPERGGKFSIEKGWNLLYHLGGNGPWIEKVDGVVSGGIGVPKGCRVEQVHMVGHLPASS
jgi:hypothetical protein